MSNKAAAMLLPIPFKRENNSSNFNEGTTKVARDVVENIYLSGRKHYESPHQGAFPKIQILTIAGLLDGTERPHWPDLSFGEQNFKKSKAAGKNSKQKGLFEE